VAGQCRTAVMRSPRPVGPNRGTGHPHHQESLPYRYPRRHSWYRKSDHTV